MCLNLLPSVSVFGRLQPVLMPEFKCKIYSLTSGSGSRHSHGQFALCLHVYLVFPHLANDAIFFLAQAHEDSQESLSPLPRRDTMGSFLPDNSAYELRAAIGEAKAAQH